MTIYSYQFIAIDTNGNLMPNAVGSFYAASDTALATPLLVTNQDGTTTSSPTANRIGLVTFTVDMTDVRGWWKSGANAQPVTALEASDQAAADAAASADAAAASQTAAEAAQAAAEQAATGPTTTVVEQVLANDLADPTSNTRASLDYSYPNRTTRLKHAPAFNLYFPEAEGGSIAAALTTAAATPGAQVQLAAGASYSVAASIAFPSHVRLVGNGATILWTGTGDRPLFPSGVSDVTISDLTLDVGAKSSGTSILAFNCDQVRIERVKVKSTATTGGVAINLQNCTNSTIERCAVTGTGWAYNITGSSSVCKIINSTATGTPAGVLINPVSTSAPSDIDVIGVTVKDFPAAVLSYPIRSAGTSSAHNTNIRFIDCTVLGPSRGYIDGTTPGGTADQINAVYTDGYMVSGCTSKFGGDMGFSMSYCTHATLTGNTAANNTTGGIVASTNCSFVTITGNTVLNNGQNWDGHAPTADSRFGIGTGSASNVTITGNTIGDDQATPTQSYGVRLEFGGDNITVGPNTYKGNVTAKFHTDGLPTNVNNLDAGGSADVFGKRVAYASVTAAVTATTATANVWTAFTGAPSITLPNDGGIYRVDLQGTSATMQGTALLTIGLSGDGGSTWIKQSSASHGTSAIDRPHMSAGNVIGSGQTITVWALISVANDLATLAATGSSPLELWATRVA